MVFIEINLLFQVYSSLPLQFNLIATSTWSSYRNIDFCATLYVQTSDHEYCSFSWIYHKFLMTFSDLCCQSRGEFCHLGIHRVPFTQTYNTTSSFIVQAGCVEAGKSPKKTTTLLGFRQESLRMSYTLYRQAHGIITYLLGFWQLY